MKKKIFLIIVVSNLLMNCLNNNKTYYEHSWKNSSEGVINDEINYNDYIWKEYDEKYISIRQYNVNAEIIKDDFKNQYITLLYESVYIEITREEANNIVYNQFMLENKRYFIVRALYPLLGGVYTLILTNDNNLFIHYSVLARRNYKLKEDVLLIEADNPPENIFISFSIAR